MVIGFVSLSVLVILLALANLGTMREIVVLRSELASFAQLVTTPPSPPWMEHGQPPDALVQLHDRLANEPGRQVLLLFIESNCPTCRALVSELSQSDLPNTVRERLVCIFPERQVDDSRTASLSNKIKISMFGCVFDEGNRLHSAAGIYGAPSALLMTRDKGLDFKAGVNLEWIRDRVVRPVPTGPPAP
jgi:hypothetical protein